MESVANLFCKNFTGTLIEDPVLEPYFITCESGMYTVSKKRLNSNGTLKYSDIYYPATLEGCLLRIAKEKLTDGQVFDSVQKYIDEWHKITDNIFSVVQKAGIQNL